jgi:hypothetical protein
MADSPFTPTQATTVNRLSIVMFFAGPILTLIGLAWVAYALVDFVMSPWQGLLSIIPVAFDATIGGLVAFSGFAFVAGSSDAKYLHDVKGREGVHLTNLLQSLNVGYSALLIAASALAFVSFIRIWI